MNSGPTAPPKADPTRDPVALDLRYVRVLWMYVSERGTIVIQEENATGTITDMRIVRRTDRAVIVTSQVRPAEPGEPRVCGHPTLVTATVASVPSTDAILTDLRRVGGPQLHQIEVRASQSDWHVAEPLDWTKLAGKPCLN